MALLFTKMHGLGNDYVYITTFDQRVSDPPALARAISDRHRGVGSDGLILVGPAEAPGADVRMIMYNADGSRSEMCGNGVRCVAKLVYERGLARSNPLRVQTDRGVLRLDLLLDTRQRVGDVRVDMGRPLLAAAEIPTRLAGERIIAAPFVVAEHELPVTCVSMGNPHAVFFVDDLGDVPLREWGPRIERDPAFPQRINVHFAVRCSPERIRMITWERGTGPTQACGTGACAVCVAGVLEKRTGRDVEIELPGGELRVAWDATSNHVFMTGPATEVFTGTWPGENGE